MIDTRSLGREEGCRLLAEFVPRAGRAYAAQRNFDRGPGDRTNVSMLSPYVRHRVVAEAEVLAAILAEHSPSEAFKSVQEVMWRTYWKGWLESHPRVWAQYFEGIAAASQRLETSPHQREKYAAATRGETGNAAFDLWVRELVDTGYLHNHARMWFASIWIFTLELPWELGADFFMRHLLDGDPASNTLSWRWIGGRQTLGKTYLATRRNISFYTEGRVDAGATLARSASAPRGQTRPELEPLDPLSSDTPGNRAALLVLHDDDLGVATLPFDRNAVGAVASLVLTSLRSPEAVAPSVGSFTAMLAREAVDALVAGDAAAGAGVHHVTGVAESARAVVAIARERGLARVVTPYGTVGPGRDMVEALRGQCAASGLAFERIVRPYDAATWPSATSGFFAFGKHIPKMLRELGISSPPEVVAG